MKRFIFISLLMSFFALVVNAQGPAKIEVSDDVYVLKGSSGLGSSEVLISRYNTNADYRRMIFLQFDLNELNAINLSEIESIKLKLYGTADEVNDDGSHTLDVFNMTATNSTFTWTEDDLDFAKWLGDGGADGSGNSATKSGSSNAYFFRRNPNLTIDNNNGKPRYRIARAENVIGGPKWIEWDVTEAIKAYAGSTLSLQICDATVATNSGGNSYVTFHSKENVSGNAPYLEIIYKDADISRSVTVDADTYISDPTAYPDERGAGDGVEPFGNDIEIVAMYNHAPTHSRRALLKFNIPFNPELIEEAQLYLYGKVSNSVAKSKNYDDMVNGTYHVYNMNYFMHNQTIFTPYVYDWDEDIVFTDWTNGKTNAADMLLTENNPFYSRRNPDDNQSNNTAGQRYGVPGTEISKIGPAEVLELDKYHWFRFDLDLSSAASILNFIDEPLSLQVCGYGATQDNSLEYVPLYIHSKENSSGNAPYLQFSMKESDLLLSEIKVDGVAIADFDPYIMEYTVTIPLDASSAPPVAGTLKTAGASVTPVQAPATDGTATITVDSGTDQLVYSITFDPSGPTSIDEVKNEPMFALNDKTLSFSNVAAQSDLLITDLTGKIIHQVQITGDYEYTFQNNGIYIVSISNSLSSMKQKMIVK